MTIRLFYLVIIILLFCGCGNSREKGDSFLENKRYSRAIESYRAALNFNPDDSNAHSGLALASLGKINLKYRVNSLFADESLDKDISDYSRDPASFIEYTNVVNEAVSHFEQAFKIDQSNEQALTYLGLLYFYQGRNREGRFAAVKALELNRKNPLANLYLSLNLAFQTGTNCFDITIDRVVSTGLLKQSLGYIKQAISLKPDLIDNRSIQFFLNSLQTQIKVRGES
ncbi:MAG: tetratricopeptide repeat protein [Candidatus Omnitrophica bacterium]|nr:tetratricopeptide repeat protein [Candidatus Omnitrophota bacterium]